MEGWALGGVREHTIRCARLIKSACMSEGECGADLRVWFGSDRNKFVQLLIQSRNSSSQFVQSLLFSVSSQIGVISLFNIMYQAII